MREAEKKMLAAINWSGKNWKSGNTAVNIKNDRILILLHDNEIATIFPNGEAVLNEETLQKWDTATTASRLRALGFGIYHKDYNILPHASRITVPAFARYIRQD